MEDIKASLDTKHIEASLDIEASVDSKQSPNARLIIPTCAASFYGHIPVRINLRRPSMP